MANDIKKKELKLARSKSELWRTYLNAIAVLLQIVIIVKLFFFT